MAHATLPYAVEVRVSSLDLGNLRSTRSPLNRKHTSNAGAVRWSSHRSFGFPALPLKTASKRGDVASRGYVSSLCCFSHVSQ